MGHWGRIRQERGVGVRELSAPPPALQVFFFQICMCGRKKENLKEIQLPDWVVFLPIWATFDRIMRGKI